MYHKYLICTDLWHIPHTPFCLLHQYFLNQRIHDNIFKKLTRCSVAVTILTLYSQDELSCISQILETSMKIKF